MKLLLLFACLIAALSTCNASSSEDCSYESDFDDDMDKIDDVYIITAENQKDLDWLLKKLRQKKDCRAAEQLSVISSLMFAATYRMGTECAEEVADWGYTIEQNALQFTEDFDEPWLRDRIDQHDLPLDGNFEETSGGEGVTIFILDTGVRTDHVEFEGRAELYKDIVEPGKTVLGQFGDEHGHGTRCAGAAIGANVGVATKAKVLSIRVAGRTGSGTIDQSLSGFEEVKKWTEQHPGEKCVVSYSLLTRGISTILDTAVSELTKVCVVVVGAGNFGLTPSTADACLYSPARVEKAITVGASRLRQSSSSDDRAGFSCYGPCVDIYAPGHKVDLASSTGQQALVVSSGTSFAAPAVAGAAAVLLGNGYDAAAVKSLILSKAVQNKLSSLPQGNGNLLLNVEHSIFHK